MKRIILLVLLLGISACSGANRNEQTTLVVATYSVRAQPKEISEKQRKLLEEHHVDLAALQVIDRNTKRNPYDMNAVFAKSNFVFSYYSEAIKFMNGSYGISTISSYPFENTSDAKLPTSIGKVDEEKELLEILASLNYENTDLKRRRDELYAQGLVEPRVYQRVQIEKEGKQIAFYNVHLTFEDAKIRKKQLALLKEVLDQDDCEYKIMAGTFNNDQSSEELDIFRKNYELANGINGNWLTTYPLDDENMRIFSIDNIICSKNITIEEVLTIPSNLSNHLPLIAKIILN